MGVFVCVSSSSSLSSSSRTGTLVARNADNTLVGPKVVTVVVVVVVVANWEC